MAELGRPRSRRLLPHTPDDGDPQLALLSPHSTQPRLLTRLPEFAWNGIAVSRDGVRVLYARYDRRDANIGGVMVAR